MFLNVLMVLMLSTVGTSDAQATQPSPRPLNVESWTVVVTSDLTVRPSSEVAVFLGETVLYRNPGNKNEYIRVHFKFRPIVSSRKLVAYTRDMMAVNVAKYHVKEEEEAVLKARQSREIIGYTHWLTKECPLTGQTILDGIPESWLKNSESKWINVNGEFISREPYSEPDLATMELQTIGVKLKLSGQYSILRPDTADLMFSVKAKNGTALEKSNEQVRSEVLPSKLSVATDDSTPLTEDGRDDYDISPISPEDTPENFWDRYYYLVRGVKGLNPIRDATKDFKKIKKRERKIVKEQKKIAKKLKDGKISSDEASRKTESYDHDLKVMRVKMDVLKSLLVPLIEKFWSERDLDPRTAKNEYKEMIDQRIKDVDREILLTVPNSGRSLFRSHGGYRGDMANVYLLHGMPQFVYALDSQSRIVSLVLWIYLDEGLYGEMALYRRNKFRFLFYKKDDFPPFRLIADPDTMGFKYNLREITRFGYMLPNNGMNRNLSQEEIQIAQELAMQPYGTLFLRALREFSSYGFRQGQALSAPESILSVVKKAGARVHGKTPEQFESDKTHITAVCIESTCQASIPAVLDGKDTTIYVRRDALDWELSEDGTLESHIRISGVMMVHDGLKKEKRLFFKDAKLVSQKELYDKEPGAYVLVKLLSPQERADLSGKTIDLAAYLKSRQTNRYAMFDISVKVE